MLSPLKRASTNVDKFQTLRFCKSFQLWLFEEATQSENLCRGDMKLKFVYSSVLCNLVQMCGLMICEIVQLQTRQPLSKSFFYFHIFTCCTKLSYWLFYYFVPNKYYTTFWLLYIESNNNNKNPHPTTKRTNCLLKKRQEKRPQKIANMTMFPDLNLEQIRKNANTITRNYQPNAKAVINKKISKTNSISRKSQRRFFEEVQREIFGQRGMLLFLSIIVQKGKEM
ncbi:Hypothetical_protein [Hexamita inflata]|uniref:Hypothetical_protein n=1 Tax=Hexamita inflata TaxID=28002 RepID=A0ABP1KRH0_9EUKA